LAAVALGMGTARGGSLAEELAAEGDWAAAAVECARERAEGMAGEGTRLAEGMARVRLGERERGTELLEALAGDGEAGMETRCRAALEAGYARWGAGEAEQGVEGFLFAFAHSREPAVFHEAGSALRRALRERKDLREGTGAAWEQAELFRSAWTRAARERSFARMAAGTESWPARAARWPGRALVGFYRGQIAPAIGSRCSLEPSCSAYFLEATRRHGLLGIPLGADRLIREPDVVKAQERWVERADGSWRLADPVERHDGWWTEEDE